MSKRTLMTRFGGLFAVLMLWGCVSPDSSAAMADAQQCLDDGREAARKNQTAEAIELFTRAAKTNPDLAEAWYERARCEIRLRLDPALEGDSKAHEDRALDDFSIALVKNPAYADAYFNRAMILSSRAQYKQALDDLLNAIRFNTRDAESHLCMAEIYERKFEDRIVLAMEHYEKYVDLGGTDPVAREKVRVWKEFRKHSPAGQSPVPPPSSKVPTAEDEAKAQELHQKALDLLKQPDKGEAVKAMEDLLATYGHTKYVQEKYKALQAAISIFKKKDAPK
jgi:tetratricopeptide (TPR) repeat protein